VLYMELWEDDLEVDCKSTSTGLFDALCILQKVIDIVVVVETGEFLRFRVDISKKFRMSKGVLRG